MTLRGGAFGGTKFENGDIVKLRSGGPDMTVTGYEMACYQCAWFVDNDGRGASFPEDALVLVRALKDADEKPIESK